MATTFTTYRTSTAPLTVPIIGDLQNHGIVKSNLLVFPRSVLKRIYDANSSSLTSVVDNKIFMYLRSSSIAYFIVLGPDTTSTKIYFGNGLYHININSEECLCSQEHNIICPSVASSGFSYSSTPKEPSPAQEYEKDLSIVTTKIEAQQRTKFDSIAKEIEHIAEVRSIFKDCHCDNASEKKIREMAAAEEPSVSEIHASEGDKNPTTKTTKNKTDSEQQKKKPHIHVVSQRAIPMKILLDTQIRLETTRTNDFHNFRDMMAVYLGVDPDELEPVST